MPTTATWIPNDDGLDLGAAVIRGGTSPAPSWAEYASTWRDPAVPEALRSLLVESGQAQAAGDEMNDGHFLVQTGQHLVDAEVRLTFTQRAWGDLVQAIADKREGYMAYFTR